MGTGEQWGQLICHTLLFCFPHPYLLTSVLLPSTVNIADSKLKMSLSFSCAILRQFLFLFFFPLFLALLLLLTSFKFKWHHFMNYDIISLKGFPILPEVSLSFLTQGWIFIFLLPQKLQNRHNANEITFWVLVFESILTLNNWVLSS